MARSEFTWLLQTGDCNSFFHPNICHICKDVGNLIECPLCGMISYCNENHLMLHQEKHNEICKAIIELNRDRNIRDSRYMSPDEWLNFKKGNVRSIGRLLQRDLKPYEKRMFLSAKSCIVCRTQSNLSACESCMSIYVCHNHKLTEKHACVELRLSLSLDWHYVYHTQDNRKISAEYMYLNRKVVRDMRTFIRYSSLNIGPNYTWSPKDYILTDDFTGPLTLYYGMLQAQLFDHMIEDRPSMIVHLLIEQHITPNTFAAWEIILHEMSRDAKLVIVSIGPKLWERTYDYELCPICRSEFKTLISDDWCMLYSEFVKSVYYIKPDVILAYDVELWNQEATTTILQAIQRQNCPLLLTAKTKSKADDNITLIREILGSNVTPIVNDKNKFASLRPHRDDENDSVFYRNQYLAIFLNLNNTNL